MKTEYRFFALFCLQCGGLIVGHDGTHNTSVIPVFENRVLAELAASDTDGHDHQAKAVQIVIQTV